MLDPAVNRITTPWPCEPRWPSSDPNHTWRDWLETHVGIQKVDWDWGMDRNDGDRISAWFLDPVQAVHFKLFVS